MCILEKCSNRTKPFKCIFFHETFQLIRDVSFDSSMKEIEHLRMFSETLQHSIAVVCSPNTKAVNFKMYVMHFSRGIETAGVNSIEGNSAIQCKQCQTFTSRDETDCRNVLLI